MLDKYLQSERRATSDLLCDIPRFRESTSSLTEVRQKLGDFDKEKIENPGNRGSDVGKALQ